jgi:hypothetical protein
MRIGKFDSKKFHLYKLYPEFKIAVGISFVLYAIAYTIITMG